MITQIEDMPIRLINVMPLHIEVVESLPYYHRDPFDRIIVATAMSENMTILTKDSDFTKYKVSVLW